MKIILGKKTIQGINKALKEAKEKGFKEDLKVIIDIEKNKVKEIFILGKDEKVGEIN